MRVDGGELVGEGIVGADHEGVDAGQGGVLVNSRLSGEEAVNVLANRQCYKKFFSLLLIYDNDFTLIIDIYFYETFSSKQVLVLHSLDTLSGVKIKALALLS